MDLTPPFGPEDIAVAVRAVIDPLGAMVRVKVIDTPEGMDFSVEVVDAAGNTAPLYPDQT